MLQTAQRNGHKTWVPGVNLAATHKLPIQLTIPTHDLKEGEITYGD
jgi:hypothetical protein